MRTPPPPECWCPPWGEGSPAALIAAARPHAGRHRCFFGTAVLLARGRGRQSPADAMQQQCVCMGGGGGTKHPNASLTPPQPLSLLPYPSSQGSTRISWVSRVARSQPWGAAGVAAPGPAGLRPRSVLEGGRRVFFCCGISCWRGRGDYLLPAAFLCPRHKAGAVTCAGKPQSPGEGTAKRDAGPQRRPRWHQLLTPAAAAKEERDCSQRLGCWEGAVSPGACFLG